MATPIRGANSKGNTTEAVKVGTARSGGIRKVGRPSGYGGRIATSSRGGLADQSLGANNRGSGGKGAPGTGLAGRGSAGGGSVGGGVTETVRNPGGTVAGPTPTTSIGSPSPSAGGLETMPIVNPDHATLDSTFAQAMPLSSARLGPVGAASPSPLGVASSTRTPPSTNSVSGPTPSVMTSARTPPKGTSVSGATPTVMTNKRTPPKKAPAKYSGPTGKAGVAQAKARAAAAKKKAAATAAAKAKAALNKQGTHGTNRGALR